MAEAVGEWEMGEVARVKPALRATGALRLGHGSFKLTHGGSLPAVSVAYHLVGPEGAPVVAVLGGISATRYVTAGPEAWWGELFGPGRAVDTSKLRVLSFDFLGGNGATTGPRHRDHSGKAFPDIATLDQARVLAGLMSELAIPSLQAFVGASYGGMVGLAFAQAFPERLQQLCVISAAHKSAQLAVAWRTIQRQIVEFGLRAGQGGEGLALARALAMATYRTPEEFSQRFSGERLDPACPDSFPVWNYLRARGEDYTRSMDPHAFLCLSRSIDLHNVEPHHLKVKTTLVAVRQDQLVPLALCQELAASFGAACDLRILDSIYGHDAFLKEPAFFSQLLKQL